MKKTKKNPHPVCKRILHPVPLFARVLTDIDSGVKAGEGSPGLISDVSKKKKAPPLYGGHMTKIRVIN